MLNNSVGLRSTLVAAFVAMLATGCGGGGRRANVSPHSMPENGSFTGVWNSPQYGEMHLTQTANAVVGEYVKDERHGRIEGSATGTVMRFRWTEQREMVRGRPTTTTGRGYFVYRIDADTSDHLLEGEWGHDNDELGGGPWTAIRDRRRRQVGDTLRQQVQPEQQGDSFDDGNTSGGSTPSRGTPSGGQSPSSGSNNDLGEL